jgi:hypothetical protein
MKYFLESRIIDEEGTLIFESRQKLPAIMSGTSLPHTVPAAGTSFEGKRPCGKCKRFGHNARTCGTPKMKASWDKPIEHAMVVEEPPTPVESPAPVVRESASKLRGDDLLTEKEYKEVRYFRSQEGKNPLQIVNVTGFPLQQVNYAILCRTYDQYRREYDRA